MKESMDGLYGGTMVEYIGLARDMIQETLNTTISTIHDKGVDQSR